jgi:hypothetical protein
MRIVAHQSYYVEDIYMHLSYFVQNGLFAANIRMILWDINEDYRNQ